MKNELYITSVFCTFSIQFSNIAILNGDNDKWQGKFNTNNIREVTITCQTQGKSKNIDIDPVK